MIFGHVVAILEPELEQVTHNNYMARAPLPGTQQLDKPFFSIGQTSRGFYAQVSVRNEIRNFIHQAQCNKMYATCPPLKIKYYL